MQKRSKILLLAFLLIGLALRILAIPTVIPSLGIYFEKLLWFDESFTIWLTQQNWLDLLSYSTVDVHPPLYYLILKAWGMIGGFNLYYLTGLSIIFGTLSILAIFYTGREIFDTKVGLITAGILTITPTAINQSAQIRMYSLLLLLGILATFWFYRSYKQPNRKNLIIYGLFSLLLLYTHYTAIILFLIQACILLFLQRKKIAVYVTYLLVGLLYLPWLFVFNRWPDILGSDFILRSINSNKIIASILFVLHHFFYQGYVAVIFLPIIIIVIGLATYYLFQPAALKMKHLDVRIFKLLFIIWFLMILALSFLGLTLNIKYATLPLIYLSLLVGVTFYLTARFKIIVIVFLLSILLTYPSLYQVPNYWTGVYSARFLSSYISDHEQIDDVIIGVGTPSILLSYYYHGNSQIIDFMPGAHDLKNKIRRIGWPIVNQDNINEVEDLIANKKRIWLINFPNIYEDNDQLLPQWFSQHWRLSKTVSFPPDRSDGFTSILQLYEAP